MLGLAFVGNLTVLRRGNRYQRLISRGLKVPGICQGGVPNTPTLEAMTRHLEYAVDLVGVDHVGISSDFSFDYADFVDELARNPHLFDESYTRWGTIQWMPPETLLTLGEYLNSRGWSDLDVRAVLGGNFRRVAECSWRT
jgi:membrane dipeptidase